MTEPNCDMPWEVYLDWLEDQGYDQLRFIDPASINHSFYQGSYDDWGGASDLINFTNFTLSVGEVHWGINDDASGDGYDLPGEIVADGSVEYHYVDALYCTDTYMVFGNGSGP